jgi:hypothetical protein
MANEDITKIDLASVDHVMKTTRSVRLRLDLERPVPRSLIAEIYRRGSELYLQGKTGLARTGMSVAREYAAEDPRQRRMPAVVKSAVHLIENLHRVPVHVIPCIAGRFDKEDVFTQAAMWGSILPATWSLMLALRARGVASAWTTFTLLYEKETAELLGIPDNYTQAALLPVAWLKGGELHPAPRFPVGDVTYWNRWNARS